MNRPDPDRLYQLLPVVYRARDAQLGEPLRALLQVITEQVNLVEGSIDQLYENWFIETCQDWVVPYIGDLIGYRPVLDAGAPAAATTPEEQRRNKILFPRREVANTIAARRRKGSLALLEQLANDVAGWPARAVEFYALLSVFQSINHLRLDRGRTVDVRRGDALDRVDGAFDELAHTVCVRRINSTRTRGRYNIPSVGLFVWRLNPYSVTRAPAYCVDRVRHHYMFSVLGNNTPLITRPVDEPAPTHIADEMNVPAWIRRRAFDDRTADYYGHNQSINIWRDSLNQLVPLAQIVPADLSDWAYRPERNQVAVDPVLGRIAFSPRHAPESGVWVSYHYGFSADLGGGEYHRNLSPTHDYVRDDGKQGATRPEGRPNGNWLYRVGEHGEFATIKQALARWWEHKPANAVIEITDSGVYVEQIEILLDADQQLEVRAANETRPTIRLLDWYTNRPDALRVARVPPPADARGSGPVEVKENGDSGGNDAAAAPRARAPRLIFDGLLITGRGVQIVGELSAVIIRHCTLVPGWALGHECEPENDTEASLELVDTSAKLLVEHTITGTIRINESEVETDPIAIILADTILDATRPSYEALSGPDGRHAHAVLTIRRSTVFGRVLAHAVQLGENSIFHGEVQVARRQVGCVRFSYVSRDSRTPRRYNCQPNLVVAAVQAQYATGAITREEQAEGIAREELRVRPQFNSVRYGTPTYCQLAETCAPEITRGADDEAEMGVFHDLFQPQREANLRTRLDEYTPAGTDAGIIIVT